MSQLSLAEFADKLGEVMPLMAREMMKRHPGEFYKIKMTMPQFFILSFLHRQDESRMTDLAHYMSVTTAAMTGLVNRLVRDGYVVRDADPKDRRIVKVRLTQKGSRLVEKIEDHRREVVMNMFGKISQKEREDYLNILMHIKERIT